MGGKELTREEIEMLRGTAEDSLNSSGPLLDEQSCGALRAIHEGVAGRFASGLSALLRTAVEVRLTDVREQTFGQFVSALGNPACCQTLETVSPEGLLLFDIAPAILEPIVDRLLGGGARPAVARTGPLTEIERRLAVRVGRLFWDELRRGWGDVFDFDPQSVRLESDLRQVKTLPPDGTVVVIGFELTLGNSHGPAGLCMPGRLLEPVGERLATAGATAGDCLGTVRDSFVELRAELARVKITARELMDLEVGDVITTDQPIDRPLVIEVDGRRFHARPGVHEGRKAIQIEERLEGGE